MLGFESKLASRHLRSGGGQTALTIGAVAAGVVVIVFVSSVAFGVRKMVTQQLTDVLPHVTVSLPDPEPPILSDPATASVKKERQSQQLRFLNDWRVAAKTIATIPHVVTVAPCVAGAGFAARGGKQLGGQIIGVDPASLVRITPITKYLTAGHYLGLRTDETFVSYKLSKELAVGPGDRIRLTSSEGVTQPFTIAGVYDPGQDMIVTAYVLLRPGQSLFATQAGVHSILVSTDDLFRADYVADRIQALLPYKADSWSRQYPQFVSILSVYGAFAFLISGFSLIASAFAISSVLIVSVLQKAKQIGILKSIGAKRKQISRVFVLEGLGVAVIGATLGAALGVVVVLSLALIKRPSFHHQGAPENLFPTNLSATIVLVAMFAAIVTTVIAALLPARRAAALDPVQVMK
jgi:lipoprotein-releasing system permease protein